MSQQKADFSTISPLNAAAMREGTRFLYIGVDDRPVVISTTCRGDMRVICATAFTLIPAGGSTRAPRPQQPFNVREASDGCAAYTRRTRIRLVYDTPNSLCRPVAEEDDRPVSGRSIAGRPDQLEASTDEKFTVVFDAIRQLMAPPEPKKKRGIGFTARIEK